MSAATFWRVSNDGGWADYLHQTMTRAGFHNAADLSRASGVDQTQISRWLRGLGQPSVENLRRLSPALRVSLLRLLVEAGHLTKTEAQMKDVPEPAPMPGPDVLWAVEHDPALIAEAKEHLLSQYGLLRRLSEVGGIKETDQPETPAAERPLRAVARRRPPRTP